MTEPKPDPELPRGVALAWGVASHPQRGPKRELSIERIVDAAVEIADADGLGAVSMSRVAAALGFTTMSLYRYMTSKDDLILLMQERAAEVIAPDDAAERTWREGVTAWVLAVRSAYREHSWLVDIPVSGAPLTPNNFVIVDWFLREVRALPLTNGEKMSSLLLLTSYARATSAQDRDIAAAAEHSGSQGTPGLFEALAELVTAERFPDLAPLFAGGGYLPDPGDEDPDADFDFGLQRILDGIEAHVAAHGEASDAERSSATIAPPTPAVDLPRDKDVREAAKARREAEKSLREAQKREREAIKRALEREQRERERAERDRRNG